MVRQDKISKYVKQAGKGCPFSFRRKLMEELQNSISDFLEGDPGRTMEDILVHFGPPEKFTDEYILTMEATDRVNALCKGKWVKRTVCIGVVVIMLVVIVATVWIVFENSLAVGNYYTEEVYIIK